MEAETPRQILARTVRQLRQAQGFSQESFADHVGLHRTYMGDIERGKRNVSLDNIVKIARGLQIPVSRLLEGI